MNKLKDLLDEQFFPVPFGGGDFGPSLKDIIKDIPRHLVSSVINLVKRLRPGQYKQIDKTGWAAMPKGTKASLTRNMKFFDNEKDAKRYAETGQEVRSGKVVYTYKKGD